MPFPSPGDLPDSRIEPGSPALQADALPSKPPGEALKTGYACFLLRESQSTSIIRDTRVDFDNKFPNLVIFFLHVIQHTCLL